VSADETPATEAPLWQPTAIDDPSGLALRHFHAALTRSERGEGQTRAVFYGASHVASDLYTDVIRVKLQQRFGEAGAGFFLPVKALPAYRHGSIDLGDPIGFRTQRVKAASLKPDRYGLAGLYVTTRGKPAASSFSTRARGALTGHAAHFELYYAQQPGGGDIELRIDDTLHVVPTSARHLAAAYARFDVADGPHRVELRAQGDKPIKFFGMVAERDTPGVIVDTLGIPGSRAGYHLLWDDALYREHLARRSPDLIVLAYGTNESGDDDVPIARYEATLQKVVARVREVAPNASCVLVGPSDRPVRNPDATVTHRTRTDEIIAAQRRVSAALGCGFFDVAAFMGGPLAMTRWVAAIPPLGTPDHVHFTRAGYELLGQVLHDALLAGYPPPPPPDLNVSPSTPRSP
jgi:lysophospholipase L1-like esterase